MFLYLYLFCIYLYTTYIIHCICILFYIPDRGLYLPFRGGVFTVAKIKYRSPHGRRREAPLRCPCRESWFSRCPPAANDFRIGLICRKLPPACSPYLGTGGVAGRQRASCVCANTKHCAV